MIGQRVWEARQEAGLTQEDFAGRIGWTPESISKIERGVTPPDLTTLLEIASVTGKPLSDFLDAAEATPARSPARQMLEARLARLAAKLSDDQLRIATDMVEVLARWRGT